jgi:hypothetical protein
MFAKFLSVGAACVLLLTSFAAAQGRGPIGPAPGGKNCPERGVKRVPATFEGSDQGVTCSGGIGFSFNGQVYTPESSRCPNSVTYTPPHDVQDPQVVKPCTWWGPTGTTYDVTKTNYQCYFYFPFFGCGTIGFGHCCEASGPPVVVNTFPNYAEALCQPCRDGSVAQTDSTDGGSTDGEDATGD